MIFKVESIILLSAVCFQSFSSSINEKVCGDIEIQNETLSDLDQFSNCTIIGSLSLSRIESLNPFLQINNISFSHLREISGWLKIKNVGELISLKHLFPKLAVIRGRNYKQEALQLSLNNDLENIGLNSLKHIGGAIYIQHNTNLCFFDTINWKELKKNNPDDTLNIIRYNNDKCQSCSNSEFCWNEEDAQVICDPSCLSGVCERDGTCCDSQCLVGCSSNPNDCVVCRNVSFNDTCIDKCPENTFVFKDGSCITSDECEAKNLMLEGNETRMKVNNGECRNNCPVDFRMIKFDESNFTCVEPWKLHCNHDILINDTSIYSMSYDPCEIVIGFVEINVSIDVCEDENLLRKLWDLFSNVEEIYKYLKITGTNIRNLYFFRSLQRIRGTELESKKYSLILENNENLRKLFRRNVSLDRGETKLEGNPNLCLAEDCDKYSIKWEIEATTYAAEIKWNSTKKVSNNLMYAIWKGDKFYEIMQSFCSPKNANSIQEETPGVHKVYALDGNTEYAYQMFDGNLQNPIGAPKYFNTLDSTYQIIEASTTSSSITFYWTKYISYQDESSTLDDLVRLDMKAFRIPPNYELFKEQSNCNLTTNYWADYIFYPRSVNITIAVIDSMRNDIKELFKRELLNEEISKDSIGREYVYKYLDATATNFTFDDLDYFSEYFVSIRFCCQLLNEIDCTKMIIFSIQTSNDDEVDQIENLSGKVVNSNAIELKWDSPSRPNGLVVTFTIHFGIVGSEHARTLCITYQQFKDEGNRKLIKHLTTGKYEFTVMVRSLAGNGRRSDPVFVEIESSYLMYWIISSLGLILLALAILLIFQLRRFRSDGIKPENSGVTYFISKPDDGFELTHSEDQSLPSSSSQQDDVPLNSQMKVCCEFEIERENIKTFNVLGKGNFGLVFEGILQNEDDKLNVAVKTVKNEASLEESINFLKEAEIMKNFKTFHVIKLLGIVSKSKPYFVVMELMTNGDLKTFLRKNRPLVTQSNGYSKPPLRSTVPPVSHMAIQIADGMAYLSHKKFVHRDLAARNCMVSDDLTVKIGDFGLTRDIYEADYYRKQTNEVMPVRWMSPESLKDGIFSSESDVFSYGIVLWEIVTYAEQPFKGKSNPEALNFIIEGGTENRPNENCSDRIYEIMTKCWRFLPLERISFNEIIEELMSEAPNTFVEQLFYSLRK